MYARWGEKNAKRPAGCIMSTKHVGRFGALITRSIPKGSTFNTDAKRMPQEALQVHAFVWPQSTSKVKILVFRRQTKVDTAVAHWRGYPPTRKEKLSSIPPLLELVFTMLWIKPHCSLYNT